MECKSVESIRYRVGIRPQTAIIAAICNKSDMNLENIHIFLSSVHQKSFKKIEDLSKNYL